MKKVRIVEAGNGISFKIEHDDGETIEALAINLAESLNKKSYYDRQQSAFMFQSQNERRKATERSVLLYQLKEYNRNKKLNGANINVSRMEPMESYNFDLIETEMNLCLDNANNFHKKSDQFAKMAKDEERKIHGIQAKINQARSQVNHGAER